MCVCVCVSDNSGAFDILEDGTLITAVDLDYEAVTSYSLTIEAVDGGSPSLIGSTQVEINVTDINDNQPQFVTATEEDIFVAEVYH